MTSKPFEMNKSYYLKAKSYSTSSKIIQKNVISFERKELTSVDQKKIDCFSSHWLLAHSPELPRGLFIRNGNKYTELKSKDYIFISCYAIVEWYFTFSKEISWRGYISPVPLPKTLCGKTMIISTESQPDFQSLEDICCFLEYHQNKKTT
ncbi:MAG: hypothetical protein L6Q37_13310, partial [Bdellovibrionaceae bacterium]|nr:hypothetical protein [Pseudobdellovibrionaceae bacterium]